MSCSRFGHGESLFRQLMTESNAIDLDPESERFLGDWPFYLPDDTWNEDPL